MKLASSSTKVLPLVYEEVPRCVVFPVVLPFLLFVVLRARLCN